MPAKKRRHPIIEPDELRDIRLGSRVLNVATGKVFEWEEDDARAEAVLLHPKAEWTPMLALIARPEVNE